MPKKQRNSFYFFMKEMQEQLLNRGIKRSMADMPQYATESWKALSLVEREKYETMAKLYKKDPNRGGVRLASDGTPLEDHARALDEIEQAKNAMIQAVKTFLSIDFLPDKDQFIEFASKKLMYFISFNIQCQTETDIIPIEVGLVEYSIHHGIHREFHAVINPGAAPTGYGGDAKRLSENKHRIDFFGGGGPPHQTPEAAFKSILRFFSVEDGEALPPLFTQDEDLKQTTGCLEYLKKRSRQRSLKLDVWSAKYLLLELRAGAGKALPSRYLANDLLTKTCFNYHPQARCAFHDEEDCLHCALAYSKRMCYLLSDAVCTHFNVEPTERHMPTMASEEKNYDVVSVPDDSYYRSTSSLSSMNRVEDRSTSYQYRQPGRPMSSASSVSGQFQDSEYGSRPPTRNSQTSSTTRDLRQPVGQCMAQQMERMQLTTQAAVPGHGIGRGQRRAPM